MDGRSVVRRIGKSCDSIEDMIVIGEFSGSLDSFYSRC